MNQKVFGLLVFMTFASSAFVASTSYALNSKRILKPSPSVLPFLGELTYNPILKCNDGEFVFFETYQNRTSYNPSRGVLGVRSDSNISPLRLTEISLFSKTSEGASVFTTSTYGNIIVSLEGEGSLTRTVCTQSGSNVNCSPQLVTLKCERIIPPPTGFSAGN